MNMNYDLEVIKNTSQAIDMVKPEDLEIFIAFKRPNYLESTKDRPNFFNQVEFEKTELTKAEFINSKISEYETTLEFKQIKGFKQAYLVDNDKLMLSINPNKIKRDLAITTLDEVYNFNYIKVVNKKSGQIKFYWLNSYVVNEDSGSSITFMCALDYWLTYYKDIFLNVKGDLNVLKKHSPRFITKIITNENDFTDWYTFNRDGEIQEGQLIKKDDKFYKCIETFKVADPNAFPNFEDVVRVGEILPAGTIFKFLFNNAANDSVAQSRNKMFFKLTNDIEPQNRISYWEGIFGVSQWWAANTSYTKGICKRARSSQQWQTNGDYWESLEAFTSGAGFNPANWRQWISTHMPIDWVNSGHAEVVERLWQDDKFEEVEVENVGLELKGNYGKESPVWNVEPQYNNLSSNTIRSLGVRTKLEDAEESNPPVTLDDNRIYFDFGYFTRPNATSIIMGLPQQFAHSNGSVTIKPYYQGKWCQSGPKSWLVQTSYDKEGNFHNGKAITYDGDTKIDDWNNKEIKTLPWNYQANSMQDAQYGAVYSCYGPKVIPQGTYTFAGKYIYTRRYDVKAGETPETDDAYGVYVSRVPLNTTESTGAKIINRIGNVDNGWIKGNSQVASSPNAAARAGADRTWKWMVLQNNPEIGISTSKTSTTGDTKRVNNSQFRLGGGGNAVVDGELGIYLVDPTSKISDGNYANKIKYGKVTYYYPSVQQDGSFYFSNEGFNDYGGSASDKGYNVMPYGVSASIASYDGTEWSKSRYAFVTIINQPVIQIMFDNTATSRMLNSGSWNGNHSITYRVTYSINDKELSSNTDNYKAYSITEWNSKQTQEQEIVNEIGVRDEYNLLESMKLQFLPINYVKDSLWNWRYDPQIKMGHSIKHFVDYLGTKKQLFTELGTLDVIYKTQTILPNMCIDKIHWSDKDTLNNDWELINANGFLLKQYDNALPSVTDSYTQFLATNQSQLSNSYLTARENLEFTKQQNVLNTQKTDLQNSKATTNAIFSLVGGVAGVGVSAATGNMAAGGMGALGVGKGISDLMFLGQQNALNTAQTNLNNDRAIWNGKQPIAALDAKVKDIFNQPDQLNVGSTEVSGLIAYKEDLNKQFAIAGTTGGKVEFKIDTQAPTIIELENYSYQLHKEGYIENRPYFNTELFDLMKRYRFNYIQVEQLSNALKTNLPIQVINYFNSMFNDGVRLWNVFNTEINDYSKENWENDIVKFYESIENKE